ATVMLFLAAALIAGRLASRLRAQVIALRTANIHATAMQMLGRRLTKAADLGEVITAGTTALRSTLRAETWMQINGETGPVSPAGQLTEKDMTAADWTRQHGQPSGRYTDTLSHCPWWFLPIRSDQETFGVVGLKFPSNEKRLS